MAGMKVMSAVLLLLAARSTAEAAFFKQQSRGVHKEGLDVCMAPHCTAAKNTSDFDPETSPWVEVISWKPRAFVYHNFLSDEECLHVMRSAMPQMKRSTVLSSERKSVMDDIRTSYGTFLRRLQDPIIEVIEQRVADWTQLPQVYQEDMQVLRYGVGQKYGAHYDSLYSKEGHPRLATVVFYLNDVEEGGETAFTLGSEWANPDLKARVGHMSPCAEGHVAYKPKRRDALLFYSLRPDGQTDLASMHTGCPVVKGVKWTATKWIHTEDFRPESFKRPEPSELPGEPGECRDLNPQCAHWAAVGECTKNAPYMVGSASSGGSCRAACKDCTPCKPGKAGDACRESNRERGGFLLLNAEEMAMMV